MGPQAWFPWNRHKHERDHNSSLLEESGICLQGPGLGAQGHGHLKLPLIFCQTQPTEIPGGEGEGEDGAGGKDSQFHAPAIQLSPLTPQPPLTPNPTKRPT